VEDSFELAREMVTIGERMGKHTVAFVTDMSQPLGLAIGNALEVQEAIATLQGNGPADLLELCLTLGSAMVMLGGKAATLEQAREILERTITSGAALSKLRQLIAAQGGDVSQFDQPETLPGAEHKHDLVADRDGWVVDLVALKVGHASMLLGAGRATKDSVIDLGAGIMLHKKVGDRVLRGQPLATLYANEADLILGAEEELRAAYVIGDARVEPPVLVLGKV
jgi:pyrimidine-nucleoside phosphorylase